MVNKEVKLVIPKVLYDELVKSYSSEGYVSANEFVIDLIRERLGFEEGKPKKKRGKRKKNFMDYFSR